MELTNTTVVAVTGAGSGIGAAMAQAFADKHCIVIAIDIEEATAQATAEAINAGGGRAHAEVADVSDADAVEALAERIFRKHGRIDVFCANAGVSMRPLRATWEASIEDYRWLAEVNYFGFVHCVRSFVPRMIQQTGRRQIVLTSSVLALGFLPGNGPYAATKAAVTALSDALRYELSEVDPDFQVSVLYPGTVHTSIHNSERFRPVADRSSSRELVPFESSREDPYFVRVPLTAPTVAELVVEGVLQDKRAILTYPYAASGFPERAEMIQSGDPITFFP